MMHIEIQGDPETISEVLREALNCETVTEEPTEGLGFEDVLRRIKHTDQTARPTFARRRWTDGRRVRMRIGRVSISHDDYWIPWTPSQADMLADDWYEVRDR